MHLVILDRFRNQKPATTVNMMLILEAGGERGFHFLTATAVDIHIQQMGFGHDRTPYSFRFILVKVMYAYQAFILPPHSTMYYLGHY